MSCHGCARSFGFLKKEQGCAKCGFSYCKKCLMNQLCKTCTNTVAPTSTAKSIVTPPVLLQEQQLEKLEVPRKAPVIVYTDNSRMSNLKRGLSTEDQELVNRLSKLKSEIREMKNIPSQSEIEERLAKLKGIDPQVYYQKPATVFNQTRSNVDSATDLINQVREEISIDQQSDSPQCFSNIPSYYETDNAEDDVEMLLQKEAMLIQSEACLALEGLAKDKEIQERLKKLKLNKDVSVQDEPSIEKQLNDSDDDEEQASAIVKRVLAEQRLELQEDDRTINDGNEELPWCELCNEDAQLRCIGCDSDLFCRRCWKETHQDAELKHHRIENYSMKKPSF